MRTYDQILSDMKLTYKDLSGIDVEDVSDLGIRFAVLAGEVFSARTELEWLKNQMFPDTASGEYLDLHAEVRNLSRKAGKKSSGLVSFQTDPEYEIIIPSGTVCAATGNDPVRFVTTEEALSIGGNSSVTVPAEAVSVGSSGNVIEGKISVIVTPVSGVTGVSNYTFSGGSDIETDEQLRARIIDSFENISNGTNKAFYIKSAMEVSGVTAVGVIPRNRGAGTVDVFITNEEGSPSAALIAEVQSKLDEQREINVDIQVKALSLSYTNIYFEFTCRKGYDIETVKLACENAVREYFKGLSAGETMYVSDIGEYIKRVEGVKNYTINSAYTRNQSVTEQYIIVPDRIVITGVQES